MRRTALLRVALAATALLGALVTSPAWAPALLGAVASLRGSGPLGAALFAVVYATGSWLMLPASWFQGAAGFLYGPLLGVAVSWTLSVLVGAVAFELARGWLRAPLLARLEQGGRLAAIDRALARRGLGAVVLLRLSPLSPYNIVSYALGVSGVPRRTFWAGTALGSVFPAAAWTLVGASLMDLTALTTAEAGGNAPWVVMAVTLAASLGIALFVKRALDEP